MDSKLVETTDDEVLVADSEALVSLDDTLDSEVELVATAEDMRVEVVATTLLVC